MRRVGLLLSALHCFIALLLVGSLSSGCGESRPPTAPTGGRDASTFDAGVSDAASADDAETPDDAAGSDGSVDPGACGDCDGLSGNGCEIDLQDDPNHCGGCFNVCPILDNARATCVGGVCSFDCSSGFADCDRAAATGCEVDLRVSAGNCGACGETCDAQPNSTVTCSGSRCVNSCLPGYTNCDGRSDNGCELETETDVLNCGACGNVCPARPNSSPVCSLGDCAIECDDGFADCDGRTDTGCEVDLRTDLMHCGACSSPCSASNATVTCSAGTCSIETCDPTYADCNTAIADGCETSLITTSDCSACGTMCMPPGGTGTCTTGDCRILSCSPDRLDCNGELSDGCEVSPATDLANCGGCGDVCTTPNATPICASSSCEISSCHGDFGDCNSRASDGCEVDLASSPAHCGTCGHACPTVSQARSTCTASVCGFECNTGRENCDGLIGNGCEVSIGSDAANCGTCGNVCLAGGVNSVGVCVGGECGVQCRSGYADCNDDLTDGCEINVRSSSAHCGGCGNACTFPPGAVNASAVCSSGDCALDCDTGYSNCDADDSNGCETSGSCP